MASYLVDAELGVGNDGPVTRAVPDRLGARPVALRRLPLDEVGRTHLRRHAETIAVIGHPNLGLIEDVCSAGDGVLVATTLGTDTLRDRLARRPLAVDDVLGVLGAVAAALAAAHRAGLTHGAVHAGNVVWAAHAGLERPAGVPVLIDLGLDRFRGDPTAPVPTAAWREDRRALIGLARALVDGLGQPTTTREAALVALLDDRGDALVDDHHGPGDLARECERISLRPDRPLPRPTPVTSATVRPPTSAPVRRSHGARHRRPLVRPRVPGPRLVGGIALGVGALVGIVVTVDGGRVPVTDAVAHRPAADCGPADHSPTPPAARPVTGAVDLDADGCADSVWWSASDATLHVLTTPGTSPERFGLGQPGDDLVVGDWDCDGETTPALYRPATGETFRFERWASADQPVTATPGPILDPHSTPHVDGDDDGCDHIVTRT